MAYISRNVQEQVTTNYMMGLNRQVSEEDARPGEAKIFKNWELIDDEPDLVKRGGTILYEVPIPGRNPVVGLYRYYDNNGNAFTVGVSGTSIWAIQDGDAVWVEIRTGITVSLKQWRFVNWVFTANLYMVNEDQPGNVMFKWDGTMATDAVTTVATPERFKDIKMYQEKMWALSVDDQSRAPFSQPQAPETYFNTQGLNNFLAFDSDQGDKTVGMAINNTGQLTINKSVTKFSVRGRNSQEYYVVRANTNVGTIALGSIQNVENEIHDLTRFGLYSTISGTDVNYISERIQPIFRKEVNGNLLDRAVAGYQDHRYFLAVPKTGSTVNDLIIINDILANCYYTAESVIYKIHSMSVWNNEGNQGEIYYGDDQGRVMQMGQGFSDAQLKNELITGVAVNDLTVDDTASFEVNRFYNVYDSGNTFRKVVQVTAIPTPGLGGVITVNDGSTITNTDNIDGEIQLDIECEWESTTMHMGQLARRKWFFGVHFRVTGRGNTVKVKWNVDNNERVGQVPDSVLTSTGAKYNQSQYNSGAKYADIVPEQFSYKLQDGGKGQGISLNISESSQIAATLKVSYITLWYKWLALQFDFNP